MELYFDNNIPIYVQLVEWLKLDIISGKLKPGERLLSVRDMALSKKVNPNTMQKALLELESIGLIYTERTNGKFVCEDKALIETFRKEYANTIAKNFFAKMENIGLGEKEAIKYLKEIGGIE